MGVPGNLMQMIQGLMGGGGGAAPGAGGPPAAGGGNPLGNPESALKILTSMQQAPPQKGEEEAFQKASAALGTLYQRVAPRSAKAASRIGKCIVEINQARDDLKKEATSPVAAPPDLGMSGMAAPQPTEPMPGMGMM